jgi:hypothetical protein
MGEGRFGEVVNAILLALDFPQTPTLLAVTSDGLSLSEDGGSTWIGFAADVPPDEAVVAVTAPRGLHPGAPLLLGLSNGDVTRVG